MAQRGVVLFAFLLPATLRTAEALRPMRRGGGSGSSSGNGSAGLADRPSDALHCAELDVTKLGQNNTVLLDAWFNSQKHANSTGQLAYYHYKWSDKSNTGYSVFGHLFQSFDAETSTLYTAPTLAFLRDFQVYIIVSPDNLRKNPTPNYMQEEDAAVVAEWVRCGGVLMLFSNDPANSDIDHLNVLSELFGMHFNSVLRNTVDNNDVYKAKVLIAGNGPIFHDPHTAFMKEIAQSQ
jgi:unsaturated rhamnogalacturonyl hydrolase